MGAPETLARSGGRREARLFIAAWPSAEVRAALAALDRPVAPGVRWTRPDQWHLTLRFLGVCDVAEAADAFAQIRVVPRLAAVGPRTVRLGRDAVVAPVAGADALAAAVVTATEAVGAPVDPRPFTGHLTVARLRVRAACDVAGAPISARWEIEELALVESELRPEGARYTTLATRAAQSS